MIWPHLLVVGILLVSFLGLSMKKSVYNFQKKSKLLYFVVLPFFLIMIISLIISYGILHYSGKVEIWAFDLSDDGWSHFISVFQVPLAIIGLCIPIFGIVIAILKYYQQDKQLDLTQHSVYMSNYYSHMSQFISVIDDYLDNKGNELETLGNQKKFICKILWYSILLKTKDTSTNLG